MNTNPDVEKLLEEKNHPLDAEIRRVREIILSADDRITEAVKWKSPTFIYKGNIASLYMNTKRFVNLMFHKGATINDRTGLLEGEGKETRFAKFQDTADIENKKPLLRPLLGNGSGCRMRDLRSSYGIRI